jgi:hypothetical protein
VNIPTDVEPLSSASESSAAVMCTTSFCVCDDTPPSRVQGAGMEAGSPFTQAHDILQSYETPLLCYDSKCNRSELTHEE